MKRLFTGLMASSMIITLTACSTASSASVISEKEETEEVPAETAEETVPAEAPANIAYEYSAAAEGKTNDFSGIAAPHFYIYAGQKTEDEAKALIEKLGMKDTVDKWVGTITVVNPLNGESYTEEDAAVFPELLGFMVSNAKVIGLESGADFVNDYISQECYAVAGIMTIGGSMKEGLSYNVEVPAYLADASETAKNYYTAVNKNSELAETVVTDITDPAEAFADAWEKVFSKTYRQHNELTECYNSSALTQTDPYPLIPVMDPEQLGIVYNAYYSEPLNGEGKYTWFEYVPESVLNEADGTVPLVVTLHGNGNDARIQGETTGWPELAVKEGFIVVSPEWQTVALVEGTSDTKPNFFNCDGLEKEKLIEWIDMLKEKYPQIDASRIYVTGLSAGASASTLYGALYSNVFAAVGAVSGPGVDKAELEEAVKAYNGPEVPWLYICGDHDFFGMIPVDGSSRNSFQVEEGVFIQNVDPAASMFSFIQSYQKINGLEVQADYDMSVNEYYGVKGSGQKQILLGEKEALETNLSNDKGLVMRLTAIRNQAHWNYKPEAAYIWDFFKNFARNTETGELIRK